MWSMETPVWELILRAIFIFIGLFLMSKVWGHKHLADMGAFDLLILLIMGEAVQNSIISKEKSIMGGLILVTTFMILTSLMSITSYYFRKAERFLEGTPKVIIRDGKLMYKVLKKEHISLPELLESIREQGILHLHDVHLAVREANGKISVIKND